MSRTTTVNYLRNWSPNQSVDTTWKYFLIRQVTSPSSMAQRSVEGGEDVLLESRFAEDEQSNLAVNFF